MFHCILIIFLVAILGRPSPAAAQDCSGDPITGFICVDPEAENAPTGGVFSASEGFAVRRVSRAVLEDLGEDEGEEVGGGASADDGGFGTFINGSAAFMDRSEERELGSDSDTYGVVVGGDYTSESFVAALAMDYSDQNINFDNNAGKNQIDEFGIQLLGIFYPVGNLYLTGATRLAYDDYDTRRRISGNEGRTTAKGDPEGYKFSASGGVGYDFNLPYGFGIGVASSLNYEKTYVGSYNERGAEVVEGGVAAAPNLSFDSDDSHSLISTVELNATKAFSVPWGVLIPQAVFQYLHEFQDNPRTIKAELIELVEQTTPNTQSEIEFRTNNPDRDYFNLGGSVTSVFPQGWALFVDYGAVVGNDLNKEHVVTFGVRTDLDFFQNLNMF